MTAFLRVLFVASATATTVGCAHTAMTSMPSPDLRGRTYHSILVVAQIEDLGLKIAMEDRFSASRNDCAAEVHGMGYWTGTATGDSVMAGCVNRWAQRHTHFVSSHTVLFPGRDYTAEQVADVMRQYGIDATLVFTPGESGAVEGFVPPTYVTQCSGWNLYGGCTQISTSARGGFAYSKPWQQFSAKLFDATSGQGVWIATATSSGNAFAHSANLVESMADKTMQRLIADKVIQ